MSDEYAMCLCFTLAYVAALITVISIWMDAYRD